MLACIACTKHEIEDGGGNGGNGGGDASRAASNSSNNPSTKEAVKSLTSQIKDMVLKFSGSSRQCKGGGGGRHGGGSSLSSFRSKSVRHRHPSSFLDDDTGSDAGGQYTYLRAASSSSTPAWDFTSVNNENQCRAKWIPGVGMPGEGDVVLEDDGQPKEWMAQVEPGVHITFVSLPGGAGNDLKRIRFSREMFNKWQAQRWWGENYDRIMELYNVQRFNRQALPTPPRSDDGERESFYSRVGSTRESPVTPPLNKERLVRSGTNRQPPPPPPPPPPPVSGRGVHFPTVPDPSEHILPFYLHPPSGAATAVAVGVSGGIKGETSSIDASRTTTSSRDEASISISNASDLEMTEWVEQDEPGVYITIRELADGTRELRRVRFSRERFGEVHAKLWWEQNRERIQTQYL